MDDGALPTPFQEAAAVMRLWSDASDVSNLGAFDLLFGHEKAHVEINGAEEAELDDIRAISRGLDVAGNLQVSDTTLGPPNSTPTPLPEDIYSGRFDPDPRYPWTMLPYPNSRAPVQQRGTEQPQLSTEAQPDANTDESSPFACDLCPHIALDADRLEYVLPGRAMMRFRQLTGSRRHKKRHTDEAFKHRCKHGCGLGFQFPNHLQVHHDSHDWSLGPPNFPCEEECDDKQRCNKAYWRSDNLARHKREKHPKAPSVLAAPKARGKRPSSLVQPARVKKPKQKSTKNRAPKASSRVNGSRNPVSSEQSAGQAVPQQTSLPAPEPSRTTYGVAPPTPSFPHHVSTSTTGEWTSMYVEPTEPPGPGSSSSAPGGPEPSRMTYGAPVSTFSFIPNAGTSTTAEWTSTHGQPTFYPLGPIFSPSPPRAPEPNLMTYGVPAPTADYSRHVRAPGTSEWTATYGQPTASPPGSDPFSSAPAPEPSQMTYGVPDPMADYESYDSTAGWTYGEPTEPAQPPGPGSSSSSPRG
jgi:hypothetical protein